MNGKLGAVLEATPVTMETLDALQSGQLKGTNRLQLAAELAEFPLQVLDLADSLEILDLSNNHLKTLPAEFSRLQKLKIAFFSNNDFTEVPAVLSQCPNLSMVGFKSNRIAAIAEQSLPLSLRWLILTDNQLEQLPDSLGQLSQLQKLMLAGNRLRSLPETMAACQNLELIRLAANQLTALPSWLFTLPRLSWLAYAGNPLCNPVPTPAQPLPEIDWATLSVENVLGQGASGVIFKGSWGAGPQPIEVAIKLFKGQVTSDGLPLDEMRAYIAAGTHPHLVQLLGQVSHHPEQKAGLVFAFVPPTYKTLGNPPSLETCTRDTYPAATRFSLPFTLRVVQGIATAAAHLHTQGISHGDLYAHNILVDANGDSLLGDFGAASFYPAKGNSAAVEALEVRAFGCLLEDLLDRCTPEDAEPELSDRLHQLRQACLQPVVSQRPSFAKICAMFGDREVIRPRC